MTRSCFYSHLFAGALLFASGPSVAQTFTYTTISPPGSLQTTPVALGESGIVLGTWLDSNSAYHGFTFNNGAYTNIDYPKAISTIPSGFNSRGEVVGSFVDPVSKRTHAFIFRNGQFTGLNDGLSTTTLLVGINSKGVALGYGSAGTGSVFLYKHGRFTSIIDSKYVSPVAINDFGASIGNNFPPGGFQTDYLTTSYIYNDGRLTLIPVASKVVLATALNKSNDVVEFS